MLQAIRDRSQVLIVCVIVFLISLTFVLVGVQGYLTGESDVVVAEVDGDEILLSRFQNRIQQLKRRTEDLTGQQAEIDFWTSDAVKTRTLDQLIDEEILDKILEDNRFVIADDNLINEVRQIEAFKEDGIFSRDLYERMLGLNGLSVGAFEIGMRQDLMRSRLRAGLLGSEFVTDEESLFVYRLQKQTRDIGFTILQKIFFSEGVLPKEAEIVKHYESNRESFRSPENLALNYIELVPSQISSQVEEPDSKTIKSFFNSRVDNYRIAEKRKVEHLLLANSESLEDVKRGEIVQSLVKRFRAGESVDVILSDFPVEYNLEGGTTDFFERGMMTAQFEDAVFGLEITEISDPFTSQFGVHIAKLIGIEEEYIPELSSILEDVVDSYKQSKAEELLLEIADRLSEMTYEESDDLRNAADNLGLDIRETEPLTRAELIDIFDLNLVNKLFESDVLIEGLNSDLIELSDGRLVVARAKSYQPSEIPKLDKVRDSVLEHWKSEREKAEAEVFGKDLIERLRAGQSVDQIKSDIELSWEVQQAVEISDVDLNPEILRRAFEIKVLNNNPVYFGFELVSGDYAVVRVTNVLTPSSDTITPGEAALAEEDILKAQAAALWEDFTKTQRQKFDIKIHKDRL